MSLSSPQHWHTVKPGPPGRADFRLRNTSVSRSTSGSCLEDSREKETAPKGHNEKLYNSREARDGHIYQNTPGGGEGGMSTYGYRRKPACQVDSSVLTSARGLSSYRFHTLALISVRRPATFVDREHSSSPVLSEFELQGEISRCEVRTHTLDYHFLLHVGERVDLDSHQNNSPF